MTEVSSNEPIVFKSVSLERFRGFNAPVSFDVAASVVVLRGPNGTGKTSIIDALQWLLVGEVPRLRAARLRQNEEYIVNAYARDTTAQVSAVLSTSRGEVRVSRSGNRNGSTLSWEPEWSARERGSAAERALAATFGASEDVDIQTTLTSAGLLQQDAARLVLQSRPRDRFALFTQLLGLGRLESFENWASEEARTAQARTREVAQTEEDLQRRHDALHADLARVQEETARRPVVADVRRRLITALASHSLYRGEPAPEIGREDAAVIAAAAKALAAECREVASALADAQSERMTLEREERGNPPEALAEQERSLAAEIASRQQAIATAAARLEEMEAAEQSIDRMVASVLPHIAGPACPVCENDIDPHEIRARLSQMSEAGLGAAEARRELEILRAELSGTQQSLLALRTERARQAEWLRRWEALQELEATTSEQIVRLSEATSGPLRVVVNSNVAGGEGLAAIAAQLDEISQLARNLVIASDASTSGSEAYLARELSLLERQLAEAREHRHRQSASAAASAQLYTAAKDARLEVANHRLARLTPVAQDIYSRLDPHPTFTEIEMISQMYRAAGSATAQVTDQRASVTADPMLVFSSAQANIAAVSYLIALNWAAGGRVPMLLLDDPLQAMDDVNVLGFADLCRHLRRDRQLIVSTHERRFADLLERKLAPRAPGQRSIVMDFNGWDRNGPQVKVREVADQLPDGQRRILLGVPKGSQ